MASELGPEPEARGSGQRRSSAAGGEGGGASTRPGYKSREGSPKASLHPAVARRGSSNLAPSTTTSICLGKESACNPGDTADAGSIPGSGRSPGEGNGNSLRYSCLKNPMDREAWRATVRGVTKSRMQPSRPACKQGTERKKRWEGFCCDPNCPATWGAAPVSHCFLLLQMFQQRPAPGESQEGISVIPSCICKIRQERFEAGYCFVCLHLLPLLTSKGRLQPNSIILPSR